MVCRRAFSEQRQHWMPCLRPRQHTALSRPSLGGGNGQQTCAGWSRCRARVRQLRTHHAACDGRELGLVALRLEQQLLLLLPGRLLRVCTCVCVCVCVFVWIVAHQLLVGPRPCLGSAGVQAAVGVRTRRQHACSHAPRSSTAACRQRPRLAASPASCPRTWRRQPSQQLRAGWLLRCAAVGGAPC
jgi:hypothetical protein